VKPLLGTGKADVNSKDDYGWTPLSTAGANGHESIVKLLLDIGNVEVDLKENDGRTPLSRAAENGCNAT
jgi:ankyrin repeat protein